MMKKLGFTLAEVLITLGIIGVVAALTAPALVQNTGTAQTGPKLAKAVSTFETAAESLLTAQSAGAIRTIINGDSDAARSESLGENLSNYMKISQYDTSAAKYGSQGTEAQLRGYDGQSMNDGALYAVGAILGDSATYISKDGFLYVIMYVNNANNPREPFHKQDCGSVLIDINGIAAPNRVGKDAFIFALFQDGSLKPVGSTEWSSEDDINDAFYWKDGSDDKCNDTVVTSGFSCAGSIFENNLKVIYQ